MKYHIAKYLPVTNPSGVISPIAVYQLDATDDFYKDRTTNLKHLTVSGTIPYPERRSGLTGRYFSSGNVLYLSDDVFRIARDTTGAGDASLTAELIINHTALVSDRSFFSCSDGGSSATGNCLYDLRANGSYFYSHNERAARADIAINYTNSPLRLNELIYIALTVSADGQTRKLYINGKLYDTVTTTYAEKATASNVQVFRIAGHDGYGEGQTGTYFSFRITAATFSGANVLEAYEGLLEEVSYPDTNEYTALRDEYAFIDLGGEGNGETFLDTADSQGVSDQYSDFIGLGGDPSNITGVGAGEGSSSDHLMGGHDFKTGLKDNVVIEETIPTTLNTTTVDVDGYHHLLYSPAYFYFFYDATNDGWNHPTEGGFTGYARNGKEYSGGVEVGGSFAPWYSEVASEYRGNRDDFPIKSLHVLTEKEWVIFDLDAFDGTAASVKMWMRFIQSTSGYYAIGGSNYIKLKDICFVNGVAYIVGVDVNGDPNEGSLYVISFKETGRNVFYISRPYDDWRAAVGRNITHRNADNNWVQDGTPSIFVNSHRNYSVTAHEIAGVTYVILGGEEYDPCLMTFSGGVATSVVTVTGESLGQYDVNGDQRKMFFDHRGWLWYSIEKRLFRDVSWYKDGAIVADYVGHKKFKILDSSRGISLPYYIKRIVSARNKIYVATSAGVFIVDAGTMSSYLGYTTPGGGGRGYKDEEGSGEILAGGNNDVYGISVVTFTFSGKDYDYLLVMTGLSVSGGGGLTVIRTYDDTAVVSAEFPSLNEPGGFFIAPWPVLP